jgi:putative zinc finger/helix-turn-helix YgiT family protein
MNRCTNCGKESLKAGPQAVTIDSGERIFEGEADGWCCDACGEVFYDGPALESFERMAAEWIAQHGVSSYAELKFIRKAAGIRAADLAEWLGVTPETVSHWETGRHPPDVASRATIAAIVLDALQGRTTMRDRLLAQKKPDTLRKVRLGSRAA